MRNLSCMHIRADMPDARMRVRTQRTPDLELITACTLVHD